jgi:hypothetical protein
MNKFKKCIETKSTTESIQKLESATEPKENKTGLYLSGVKVGKCIREGNFGKVFIGEWSKLEVSLQPVEHSLELITVEKEVSNFQYSL